MLPSPTVLGKLAVRIITLWKDTSGRNITRTEQGGLVTRHIKVITEIKAAVSNCAFINTSAPTHNFDCPVGLLRLTLFVPTGRNTPGAPLTHSQ